MKKTLPIFIIFFLFLCPDAKSQYYGYDIIKIQQNEIIKKEKVKKIKSRYYDMIDERIISGHFIVFDLLSNVKETISQDHDNKIRHSFTYDQFNNLIIEKITDKKIKSKKYKEYWDINSLYPDHIIYKYDSINRLVKMKYCYTNDKCKSDYFRYTKNKIYKYNQGITGKIHTTEVIERKGNLEIKLEINKKNEVIQKSVISYTTDSLKLKEERFKGDTLIYRQQNIIENNKIVKTIQSSFYKEKKSNTMEVLSRGERFVFNSDSSVKEILSFDSVLSRDEFLYNSKGLLTTINSYIDDKLRYTTKYKYNMW